MAEKATEIKALYDAYDRDDLLGGYAVGILEKGEVIYKQAYGFANHEYEIPFTSRTLFDFASVAKQFTGYCFSLLLHQKKLALDNNIRKYLPELPSYAHEITVHHLLSHTSGLRDWFPLAHLAGHGENDRITADFLMKLICAQTELNFIPGDRYTYSNTGYFLLAKIVERITGKTFRQFTNEKIFEPLKMTNTFFLDNESEVIRNRAVPYQENSNGNYGQGSSRLISAGSSSLFSTLDDMIKWMQQIDLWINEGNEIIEQMLTPTILNSGQKIKYNFGIANGTWNGHTCFGHGGGWNAFASEVVYFPPERAAIIFFSNRTPNHVNTSDAIRQILLEYSIPQKDLSGIKPDKEATVTINAAEMALYLGRYVSRIEGSNNFFQEIAVDWKENRLTLSSNLWPTLYLQQKNEYNFSSEEEQHQISFHIDSDGICTGLTVRHNEKEYTFSRLKECVTDYAMVEDYLGEYYSQEIQTGYSICLRNDQLIAENLTNEDVILRMVEEDIFWGNQFWFEDVRFTRDAQDAVDGFLVSANSGNMMLNLRFNKLG